MFIPRFHPLLQFRECVSILYAAALSVLLIFCAVTFFDPSDASAEKMNKLYEIQQKIRNVWDNIDESKEEERSIRTNIQNVNETIGKKERELRNYDKRMSQTQSEISDLEKDIDTLTAELDGRKQYLK